MNVHFPFHHTVPAYNSHCASIRPVRLLGGNHLRCLLQDQACPHSTWTSQLSCCIYGLYTTCLPWLIYKKEKCLGQGVRLLMQRVNLCPLDRQNGMVSSVCAVAEPKHGPTTKQVRQGMIAISVLFGLLSFKIQIRNQNCFLSGLSFIYIDIKFCWSAALKNLILRLNKSRPLCSAC